MSAMSESAEIELCQNASNGDLVEKSHFEANGDYSNDQIDGSPMKPDVDSVVESEIINGDNSDCEHQFGICATTGMTGMTRVNGVNEASDVNGVNSMRNISTNGATQLADVCHHNDRSADTDTDDEVDDMPEDPKRDRNCLKPHNSNAAISSLPASNVSNNQILIIETVVKTNSNEVTVITESTVNTTHSSSSDSLDQSSTDSNSNTTGNTNDNNINNNSNNNNNKISETNEMTTKTSSTYRPKQLKSLLKKSMKENSIKTSNISERKRVTFSETMQVFCDDWPQNLMPQIIALKSPTDFNLVEVQGYMFEPPVEYQDFLPFEPPPDYRDFIANSLCAYDNDLSINYIDDEEEDDNTIESNNKSEQKFLNEFSSKWESMILNNSETLEEDQIIGVLKEDAILQAIGSHISLPEEQLSEEDFPIHFQNKDNLKTDSLVKLAESELSDITSEDGNDSSPTGSLQDIASDSSITSQDTIILINSDIDNNDKTDCKDVCNEESKPVTNYEKNSECLVNCRTESYELATNADSFDEQINNELNSDTNNALLSERSTETQGDAECESVKRVEGLDSTPDVIDINRVQKSETTHESDLIQNNDKNPLECELNNDKKNFNIFNNVESTDMQTNHSNAFRRNLMFYENMFSDNNKSENNLKPNPNQPIKQTVSHFIIDNNPKLPIITHSVNYSNNNISEKSVISQNSEPLDEVKQMPSSEVTSRPLAPSNDQSNQSLPSRAPTHETQPNANNWSTDEFIIEYTSEPRALVPSKRTASLSNFATAQLVTNPQIIPNRNNNNFNYLSLNRNGETPKQWIEYNVELHNNSQQIRYPYPPNQRSLSPNPVPIPPTARSLSPQQVYYQNRPQYNPRYPTTQTMPMHVMYNRVPGPQPNHHGVSVRLPAMNQTMGAQHKHPPPYHYHIQQHSNEFPNPSEIRRRDGLNAYPHVLHQTPQAGALPVPPIHHNNPNSGQPLSKDELEQFVQQDIQRTERIKKRYSMTEEDDPSFGFARRPSVRGIRPKFGTTNEILKQIQTNSPIVSQLSGSHVSWPQTINTNNNSNNNNMNNQIPTQHNSSFLKKQPIVQIRVSQQNAMSIKHMNEQSLVNHDSSQAKQALHGSHAPHLTNASQVPQMSRTLPRPSSLITQSQMNAMRSEDGLVIRVFANSSRDQLKQQIQRQLEQQLQPKLKQRVTSMSSINVKPLMSSNDERGAPEGASSSPKHSSDLLFAKNLNTSTNNSVKFGDLNVNKSNKSTANKQQTNDTKKLVIAEETDAINATNTKPHDNEGVIYYSMNV